MWVNRASNSEQDVNSKMLINGRQNAMFKSFKILLFLFVFFLLNYNYLEARESPDMNDIETINKLSKSFEILSKKNIYFGHQSVGYNILDGVRDLQESIQNKLNIVEVKKNNGLEESGVYHAKIGKNGDPISKIDDFVNQIDAVIGIPLNIAFLKFCYVDINADTDVKTLFNYYKNKMAAMGKKYPETKIIHFTVPLNTTVTTWKTKLKIFLKKNVWEYEGNIKKNEYNSLVKKYYEGKEPVFDIAYYESLSPDRSRSSFTMNGKTYFDLFPKYTNDGGHLNEQGRRWIAEHLINFLTTVEENNR